MTEPTTLPRLAEVPDLSAWPGVMIDGDTEVASATAVLDAASALIRLESGDVNRWPTAPPPAIKALCVIVAARVIRNPDCATQIVTGPFSEGFTQGVEDALYLSANDRRTITQSLARPGLWTQSLTKGDDPGLPYLEDCFTGERVPRSTYPDADWLLA